MRPARRTLIEDNVGAADKPQFFRIGSSVVTEGALKAMTAVDMKVYMVLAMHANWTTGKCWPSYRTIRTLTGCSFDCIADAIRRLVRLGAISAQRDRGKRGRRNYYTVYRTIQPSPGICSEQPEHKPIQQNRDQKGRYRSERTDKVCSDGTEDLCSDGTEQNDIHLNNVHQTRSKGEDASEASARHSLIISEKILKDLEKKWGREKLRQYMREKNYPETLLGEEAAK